jgi:acetyl-CoA carboxylase biotin carboxyl carrier protein
MNDKKIDYEEITKLVSFLEEKHLTHFELEVEGFKIKISRALPQVSAPAKGSAPAPQRDQSRLETQANPEAAEASDQFHYITSPMVGTFYRAPDPASPPFVEIGEEVKKSQTLCIIEAMKLMNEIESDMDGVVAEIYVENGKPVEFGQRLFSVRPAAA